MEFLKALVIVFILPFALSAQDYYGGIPALFDGFTYTNTQYPIAGDSTNSLYGKNIWLTENGSTVSRAWHRYNFSDEILHDKNSTIEPNETGISFKVLKGFRFGDITPIITSGFLFKHGTFVSRVRFSSLPENTLSIQAFWLFSHDGYRFKIGNDSIIYVNEVDFEWNNWFMGLGRKHLNASIIWAYHSRIPHEGEVKVMNFFKKDNSGRYQPLETRLVNSLPYYTENKWFYYLIRLDSTRQTAEFLAQSAENDGDKIRGGEAVVNGEITPVTHYGNFPRTRMMTMYNCGIGPVDKDSIVREDSQMEVDWLYITPRTDAGIDAAVTEVANFKKQGISRINTTGQPTFHDSTAHLEPPRVTIEGPDEIIPLHHYTWIVRPSLKNTIYDIEYEYRRLSPAGSSEWFTQSAPEAVTYARPADTALEWKATVRDWRGMTASTLKTVKVQSFKNPVLADIFPNPTSGLCAITLPAGFEKKVYTVSIFTIEGKKITGYSSTETQFATIELSAQPAGQYMVVLSTDDESFKTTITVVR